MTVYPKWLYHKTLPEKVVNSKEEHDALGKGWEETPAAFDKKSDEASQESTGDKNQGSKEPDIKKVNFAAMTVKELKEALIKNGKTEEELKTLKKDELIVLLGAG